MKRSDEERLLYMLLAYLATSLLGTLLLLLISLAAMKLFFALALFALGPTEVYWLKPALYDSLGFALSSAGTALGQYLLTSFLRLAARDRLFLSMIVSFTALFSGLLFWRGAVYSSLGAYPFSGLCVALSALLGGLAAALQAPSENPFSPSLTSRAAER